MKKLLQRFLLAGLGAVVVTAGFSFMSFLPGIEWAGPSYAGTFTKADAGPAWSRCNEKCSTSTYIPPCKTGCEYSYHLTINWSKYDAGDAGPVYKQCKEQCNSTYYNNACIQGCDNYYSVVSHW